MALTAAYDFVFALQDKSYRGMIEREGVEPDYLVS
jgi:hypothetical protein